MEELSSLSAWSSALSRGLSSGSPSVVLFGASWHGPSQQVRATLGELSSEYPLLQFLYLEAEAVPEVSEKFEVESVPLTVLLSSKGEVERRMKGASIPELVREVERIASRTEVLSRVEKLDNSSSNSDSSSRLEKLIHAAPVMVFMKGEPSAPRCKFSRALVELLREAGIVFGYFDILTDNEVREGLKEFSNWRTYPQVYIQGKLIGGLDIVKELHEQGELVDMIPKAASKQDLKARLESLVKKSPVMLFMKGTPDAPQCGFSSKIVSLLKEAGLKMDKFGSFNILEDNEVRQGLKTYSNWPTFPQLYVQGKLIGGLDIAVEMHQDGELEELLASI